MSAVKMTVAVACVVGVWLFLVVEIAMGLRG